MKWIFRNANSRTGTTIGNAISARGITADHVCRSRSVATRSPRFGEISVSATSSRSHDAKGRHDLRAGGEFPRWWTRAATVKCAGRIDARNGTTPPNIEALFPDPFDADTWNLAAISTGADP
jgi:hypothetical protein